MYLYLYIYMYFIFCKSPERRRKRIKQNVWKQISWTCKLSYDSPRV